MLSKVTIVARPGCRSTLIRPAASSFANARRFVSRLTPYLASAVLDKMKVVLLLFHARCRSQIKTKHWREPMALVAAFDQWSGILLNRSASRRRALLC